MAQNPLQILGSQKFYYGTTPKQPVAEQNQTYFAYFDGVGGTGPEYIDGTAYFIKYLIDTEGNVVNPEPFTVADSPQAVGLYNLTDNFEVGKNATIKLIETNPLYDEIPNAEILQGTYRIAHVGRIVPILVTETGENVQDYITTMSFDFPFTPNVGSTLPPPTSTTFVPDVQMTFRTTFPSGYETITTSGTQLKPSLKEYSPPSGVTIWEAGSGAVGVVANGWKINSSSADTGTRIKFTIKPPDIGLYYLDNAGNEGTHYVYISIEIRKNGSAIWNGGSQIVSWTDQPNSVDNNITNHTGLVPPGSWEPESPWFDNYNADDEFTFFIKADSQTSEKYAFFYIEANSQFRIKVIQETVPGLSTGTPTEPLYSDGFTAMYSPYFVGVRNFLNSIGTNETGNFLEEIQAPFNYSYILMSDSASAIYDNTGLTQNLDPASVPMNFSEITIPFSDIKAGDFIRFEYNKEQTYTIIDVIRNYQPNNQSPDVYTAIKVTPNIGMGAIGAPTLNLNHFVIYRVLNDGVYVTLDVKKDAPGGAYSGILQPEFVSKELVQKYDKIIQNLTEKEIIQ
jgi:hypothetical protein